MRARPAPLLVKDGAWAIALHDHPEQRIWSTAQRIHRTTPERLQGLRTASQTLQVQRIGPYLDDDRDHP